MTINKTETETVYFRYARCGIKSKISVPKGTAHKHVDTKLIIKIVPDEVSPSNRPHQLIWQESGTAPSLASPINGLAARVK